VQRFLSSSQPPAGLSQLSIRLYYWELSKQADEVIADMITLPHIQSLRQLHIDVPNVNGKAFLNHFIIHKGRTPILPHLQEIFLGGCCTDNNPGPNPLSPGSTVTRGHAFGKVKQSLRKLVNSRKKSPLRMICIETKGALSDAVKIEFRESLTQNKSDMKEGRSKKIRILVVHFRVWPWNTRSVFLTPQEGTNIG
jgi:hypothetical protein